MIRRRRSTKLTDYRSMLDSRGDISVGAYADQQRRRRLVVALVGLLLLLGAAWLYAILVADDEIPSAGHHPVAVACVNEDCGYQGVIRVKTGEEAFPITCPECKQRSCHKLWECRACGRQFLLRGGRGEPACPWCGSTIIGAAEELHPQADAP